MRDIIEEKYSEQRTVLASQTELHSDRGEGVRSVTLYRVIIFYVRTSLVDFKGPLGVKVRFQSSHGMNGKGASRGTSVGSNREVGNWKLD